MKPWLGLSRRDPQQRMADRALIAEVCTSDSAWASERRSEYLRDQITAARADLADDVKWAKSLVNPDAATILFLRSIYRNKRDHLQRMERELRYLSQPPRSDQVTEDDIAKARAYPLYELLEKRPGEKVPCIFHDDSNPSMYLYAKGHCVCFVCHHGTDSIGYLMKTRQLKFFDAVRALL